MAPLEGPISFTPAELPLEPEPVPPRLPSFSSKRSYKILRVLHHDKPEVAVLLGEASESDSTRSGGRSSFVAIKVLRLVHAAERQLALAELACMRRASADLSRSRHVIQLLDSTRHGQLLYLVMPYMDGGDLCQSVQSSPDGLQPAQARHIFVQMVQGLVSLKQAGIAHGDVSLENFMLSSPADGDLGALPMVHVVDLGSSHPIVSGAHGQCGDDPYVFRGKLAYLPPEVVTGEPSSQLDVLAADVWSLGVCLWCMLTGSMLYLRPEDSAFQVLLRGEAGKLLSHYGGMGIGTQIDPLAKQLICSMLSVVPDERPRLDQILGHAWLTNC